MKTSSLPHTHVKLILAIVAIGLLGTSQRSDASSRQYVPFMPPDAPSRNYLRYDAPTITFKKEPRQPSLAEVVLYRERLIARDSEDDLDNLANEVLHPGTMPSEVYDARLPVPSLSFGAEKPATPDIVVAPWFSTQIPNQQQSAPPNQGDPANPNAVPWIQRTLPSGNTVFIPFSYNPNNYQPPAASSAIIYEQPDAMRH